MLSTPLNSPQQTEHQLIEGLASNSIECYEALFRRYFDRIHAFALGMVKDEDAAADIAQNVFLKLWTNRANLRTECESLHNYLFVITRHEVLNHLRDRRLTVVSFSELADTLASPESVAVAESAIDGEELRRALQEAIQTLPDKRRQVFLLSRFKHMSNKEIALRLDLSVRTVEKHIELALRDIRRRVSPYAFLLMLLIKLF
jgi:RNA polymerase sigma-70 factor (ECF subfamily)